MEAEILETNLSDTLNIAGARVPLARVQKTLKPFVAETRETAERRHEAGIVFRPGPDDYRSQKSLRPGEGFFFRNEVTGECTPISGAGSTSSAALAHMFNRMATPEREGLKVVYRVDADPANEMPLKWSPTSGFMRQ